MTSENPTEANQSGGHAVAPPRPGARPGAIILARHGEPALSRKVWLTSQGYRDWWAKYEIGGLLEGQTPPDALKAAVAGAGVVYSSTRPRSIETANALADGRVIPADVMFIEAPLPPPKFPDWFKLTPRWWGVVARAWWWFFDHHEGQENRAQAEARAVQAADRLTAHAADGRDVVVLAHGFFNGMIGMELARRGWRCTRDKGFRYWSARRFERT